MKLHASGEDYLEAILVLHKKMGMVRSVDVARHLEVTKPSVCHAVATLRDGGFLTMDSDYFLHLTDAFRKSRREIIFIIMFSFNSYLSIFTGAILHAPVIPVRIIPLQHPTVQENKFTRLKEFFCAISTNAFWARQFLFSKHHNFSYICNLPTKAKNYVIFLSKRLQNVAWSLLGTPCISCIS